MCLGSNNSDQPRKKDKKRGLCASFIFTDYYEQEIKFNVKGRTSVPSCAGMSLSFLIRCLILTFTVERIMAWLSFDRFKILTFDTVLDFKASGDYSI